MHLVIVTARDLTVPQAPVARYRTLRTAWVRSGLGECTLYPLRGEFSKGTSSPPAIRARLARITHQISWRRKALYSFRASLKAFGELRNELFILAADRDPLLLSGIIWICHREGVRVFHEVTEYPDVVLPGGLMARVREWLYWASVRRLDGVFAITQTLKDAVRAKTGATALVVPAFVDVSEFAMDQHVQREELLICYAGSLNEAKDGVRFLIRAFASVVHASPGLTLALRIIAGGYSEDQKEGVLGLIADLGLEDRAHVMGPVDRSRIPSLLGQAGILVMPRPASRQAEGGFPTKLGEYLATGLPTIATRVGPVGAYLEDHVNALLIEPGDMDGLTRALGLLTNDESLRNELGMNGRRVAFERLSADVHAVRIADFVRGEGR